MRLAFVFLGTASCSCWPEPSHQPADAFDCPNFEDATRAQDLVDVELSDPELDAMFAEMGALDASCPDGWTTEERDRALQLCGAISAVLEEIVDGTRDLEAGEISCVAAAVEAFTRACTEPCIPVSGGDADADGDADSDSDDDCVPDAGSGYPGSDAGPGRPAAADACVPLEGGSWAREEVDFDGDTGFDPSVAVSPSGAVHVAYVENVTRTLMHATNESGDWTTESLHHAFWDTSIAIDDAGRVHVGFSSNLLVDEGVKYALLDGGKWTIDDVAFGWANVSIALGAADAPYLGFGDYDVVYVATNASGVWEVERVTDSYSAWDPEVAIGPDGEPRLFWGTASDDYWYAQKVDGCWSVERVAVDSGRQFATSLVVDSTGAPGVAWSSYDTGLHYARPIDGRWEDETIDASGTAPAMVLDAADVVHMTYFDAVDGEVHYATNATGAWVIEIIEWIEESGVYRNDAIAIGDGAIHVVYRDFRRGGVVYARRECAP